MLSDLRAIRADFHAEVGAICPRHGERQWHSDLLSSTSMDRREKAEGENESSKSAGQLTRKDYERELERLHVELVKLQEWTKSAGARICILFEGRDGAGKGGTIKAITERVSPRVFRVVALSS